MPNYIRQWKINNQIADLRDGTKGLPNGAVPLGSDGKISYDLVKYYADNIAVSRTNAKSIAKWASSVVSNVELPIFWTNCDTVGESYQKIRYLADVFIIAGASGIKYSIDGISFIPTNITSFSSTVTIEFIEYLGGKYFVGCNLGLWYSTDLTTWTQCLNYGVTHIAYDGTRYECVTTDVNASLKTSTDGITWTTDTFFSSLGSVNTSTRTVWGVWYIDGIWWLNAYYTSSSDYALFFYDGTHFSIPVTIGSIFGLKWKAIHRTHNIDGLLEGDVWIIASVGENNQSRIYCSETLYGVEWRHSTTIPSVTTDFVEHKGVLYIGNTSGIAYMDPVGAYYFYTRRLSDVIGQNPCRDIVTTGELLIVAGGQKTLYSQDAIRWYRGLSNVTCYSTAYGNNKVLVIGYSSSLNNTILYSNITMPEQLYL